MRQLKQGQRSTKTLETNIEEILDVPMKKESDVMVKIYKVRETIYTDQTGKFPFCSSKGNKYIMVMCEMDGNVI